MQALKLKNFQLLAIYNSYLVEILIYQVHDMGFVIGLPASLLCVWLQIENTLVTLAGSKDTENEKKGKEGHNESEQS